MPDDGLLDLVLAVFPGATLMAGAAPPAGDPPSASVLAALAAADALADAVEGMMSHFGLKEPGRLDRPGWVAIQEALTAYRAARK